MRESTIFQRLSAEGRGGLMSFIRFRRVISGQV